jgi:hypothetical protein
VSRGAGKNWAMKVALLRYVQDFMVVNFDGTEENGSICLART